MVRSSESPAVFANFSGKEILAEMGRLLFALLNAFAASGYHIRLFDSLPRAALDKYGRLACSLPHVSLTDAIPSGTSEMIYLFDEEGRALGAVRGARRSRSDSTYSRPIGLRGRY